MHRFGRRRGVQQRAEIALKLGIHRHTARLWRRRKWLAARERLEEAEASSSSCEKVLRECIEDVLADAPRSTTPATFAPEQICRIVALACEDPGEESGRPVTHWTTAELADEAVKRGIVESISPRSVGRFLGRGGSEAPSGAFLQTQRASERSSRRSLMRRRLGQFGRMLR